MTDTSEVVGLLGRLNGSRQDAYRRNGSGQNGMPPQKQNEIGQTEKNKNEVKIGPGRQAIKLCSPSLTLRYDKLECFCSATTLSIM